MRRPPGFYAHLMDTENQPVAAMPEAARGLLDQYTLCLEGLERQESDKALPVSWSRMTHGAGLAQSAQLSQLPYSHDVDQDDGEVFPEQRLDADLQQVDLRTTNSWRLMLGDVPTAEMLEIQLVNAVAPFVLCNHLSGLMKKDYTGKKTHRQRLSHGGQVFAL